MSTLLQEWEHELRRYTNKCEKKDVWVGSCKGQEEQESQGQVGLLRVRNERFAANKVTTLIRYLMVLSYGNNV